MMWMRSYTADCVRYHVWTLGWEIFLLLEIFPMVQRSVGSEEVMATICCYLSWWRQCSWWCTSPCIDAFLCLFWFSCVFQIYRHQTDFNFWVRSDHLQILFMLHSIVSIKKFWVLIKVYSLGGKHSISLLTFEVLWSFLCKSHWYCLEIATLPGCKLTVWQFFVHESISTCCGRWDSAASWD